MQHGTDPTTAHERILSEARNAMMYEDGELKPMTLHSSKLLDAAMKTGHPDALFLKGLSKYFISPEEAVKWFHRADARGCRDPWLYYFLAQYEESKINPLGSLVAKGYYEKSLGSKYTIDPFSAKFSFISTN